MLASDITGFHTFMATTKDPELIKGPIFANIVLADESWAFIHGRSFVTPGDVKQTGPLVLPHRIISRHGEASAIIEAVFNETAVPL